MFGASHQRCVDLAFKFLTAGLWSGQAASINVRYSSKEEYLEGFSWPLLEETRATILQELEDIQSAPRLVGQVQEGRYSRKSAPSDIKTFQLKWSSTTEPIATCNYNPRSYDLVLLTSAVPRSLDDLEKAENLHMLGLISGPQL